MDPVAWTMLAAHCLMRPISQDLLTPSSGMVGLMGTAALTKKKGGYSNTKLHGIMASAGLLCAAGGFYVIYQNKISMGKDHFTTLHGKGKNEAV